MGVRAVFGFQFVSICFPDKTKRTPGEECVYKMGPSRLVSSPAERFEWRSVKNRAPSILGRSGGSVDPAGSSHR